MSTEPGRRTEPRPRRYVARQWLSLLKPLFRYSYPRDAFVLRVVGRHVGPVLRPDRRREPRPVEGVNRRKPSVA
jgi:hypothetical protein